MSSGIRIVTGVPSGRGRSEDYRFRVAFDVLTPMRDGVMLSMDLLRPEGLARCPVVLMRTPYNKLNIGPRTRQLHEQLARRGYIVAVQDCRGRFNSDGTFDPYRQEHADGFDTIEWLAAQEWCDGNVGMIGGSYSGQTQWFAASQAPRALKAVVPTASPPGNPFLNEPLWGGIMLMAVAEWMYAMGRRTERIGGLQGFCTEQQSYLEALPLARIPDTAGFSCAWWQEWMRHPQYDAYWRSHGYEADWPRMTVPALSITGWWDMNFLGSLRNFGGMRRQAATQAARGGQRLVIGPWAHWVNSSRALSGMDFGYGALTDLDSYTVRFLDHWLRGETDESFSDEAHVHVFVVGANEWWAADEWPLPGQVSRELYLHSDGRANTHRGTGKLSWQVPDEEACDQYESDPLDPVRVLWTLHEGPVDDRFASARGDVLCYTSDVLEEPLDVVGPVKAVIYASSSARDCDWHVRLIDVHPDGTARFLCHGALKARFREGYEHPKLLTPGRIERFDIDMTATGVRFLRGHRIRVEIASTWFPRFERNPQTGAENWMIDEQPPVIAQQRVFHDRKHASHVVLPVIVQPGAGSR